MMRRILQLPVDLIDPRENPIRPVDDDYAAALAVSMNDASQLQPIIVRPKGERYEVVCGAHRLRAHQLSERSMIDAEVRDLSDIEARIAEIDENAVRKELSALDFALSMAERKRLYDELYPETARGKKKGKGNQHISLMDKMSVKQAGAGPLTFSKDAAKKTGFTDRSIRRSVELASKFDAETVQLIRNTKLANNAAALKKLALLPPDQRRDVAHSIGFGESRSIGEALAKCGHIEPVSIDPAMALTARFADLLSRSSAGQRREWLVMILRAVKSGELPALANGLAERLPSKGKKAVLDALMAVVSANEEAA